LSDAQPDQSFNSTGGEEGAAGVVEAGAVVAGVVGAAVVATGAAVVGAGVAGGGELQAARRNELTIRIDPRIKNNFFISKPSLFNLSYI